jgi:hypothetical protein
MVAKPATLSQHPNTPSLHHSITPGSIDTGTLGIPWYTLVLVIVPLKKKMPCEGRNLCPFMNIIVITAAINLINW